MTENEETSAADAGDGAILVGVGRAGCAAAAKISAAFAGRARTLLVDTDARSGTANPGCPFLLVGGNRIGGAGAGGDMQLARIAAAESAHDFDARIASARTVVLVCGAAGGTGGGATVSLLERLRKNGAVSVVFALEPFSFEGPQAASNAMRTSAGIAKHADAYVQIPLDALVGCAGADNMAEAFDRGVEALAAGATLFWTLVQNPGYIALDSERLRSFVRDSGEAVFATASAAGPDRAGIVLASLRDSPLFGPDGAPRHAGKLLVGIAGGDDLRLSEVGRLAKGTAEIFGNPREFALGTVNDPGDMSGRISAVALAFVSPAREAKPEQHRKSQQPSDPLRSAHGRFGGEERNFWNGEDLDTPTYLRRNLSLER